MSQPVDLHTEVITGVVQVIRHVHQGVSKGITQFNLGELNNVGCDGKSDRARSFIFEFIKDGFLNLPKSKVEEVINGNFEWVWEMTNKYLARFGYAPVQSIPLNL